MAVKPERRALLWLAACAAALGGAALAYVLVFLPAARAVPSTAYFGRWALAFVFAAAFSAFLIAFVVRPHPRNWRELGVSEAFLVALFTEMFGAPLTIYLLTAVGVGAVPTLGPEGHLWASLAAAGGPPQAETIAAVMLASTALIAAGIALVMQGWRAVHGASGGALVTGGIYGSCRHPQYLGFLSVVFGFLLMWPTLLTLAMAPVLAVMYVRLARREEAELARRFGAAFAAYAARVPFLLPRLRRKAPLPA